MPGSNNFTVHNPTNANQQPDSTFAGDSLTTGGVGTDAILPSVWLNARWYEDSVGFWAFAQALANKGYAMNKDNAATLAAVITSALVTNNDLKPALVGVVYSPTPTFPASTANGFDMVLAGNVASSTFDVAPNIGQTLTFVITQSSGGGATFVPPTSVNGWQPIDLAPNAVSIQQFIVKEDGTIQSTARLIALQQSPGNSFGTIYTNNTNAPKIVNVTGNNPGGTGTNGRLQLNCGPTSGSMIQVAADAQNNSAGEMFCSMVVPAGYSYQGVGNGSFGGSCVLQSWIENPIYIV